MAHLWSRSFLLVLMLLSGMGPIACASGPPVQEMSDARQAIRAARDAGAESSAPQQLAEAEALLERAERSLQKRDYRDARRDAIAARGKAVEALDAVHPAGHNAS